ncbi:hypothetical protein ACODT3_07795 [Streptomyces sp. 4.24]|uniref:hypothetical protein n=1 Tax=Streptomyces tritrimontium TaxID=3406573 RepID=UPI003BB6B345
MTARAVLVWAGFVRHPHRRLWVANDGDCGVWECCPDPHEARGFLETVALGMSGRRGRELRRILARLDAEY